MKLDFDFPTQWPPRSVELCNSLSSDSAWIVTPFDMYTPDSSVVAVSLDGRTVTAGEARKILRGGSK